jgi:hypothetical protein
MHQLQHPVANELLGNVTDTLSHTQNFFKKLFLFLKILQTHYMFRHKWPSSCVTLLWGENLCASFKSYFSCGPILVIV